jgi:hypothetical protein
MVTLCGSKSENKSRNSSFDRTARRRLKCRQKRIAILKSQLEKRDQLIQQRTKELKDATNKLEILQAELAMRSAIEPCVSSRLFEGEKPLPGFQFTLRLIVMAIELAKRVGFRGAAEAMQIMFAGLGVETRVPSHDVIEQWTLRLGVGLLKDTFMPGQRVLWMADHSSQVGKERLLLIVGVALDDLPAPGESLTFEKLKVLAVVPGVSWKKEDVEREYLKLTKQIGVPAYLLCDGAVELREPAEKLELNGQKTIVLGDLKHRAANVLEKELSRGGRFQAFLNEVGLTRNRIQQTELDQFTPPTLRSKSRFMNIGTLLNWATMVLYHLKTPESAARTGITEERMKQKLGWLLDYASDLEQWKKCQEVIDCSLSVINLQGLSAKTCELVEHSLTQNNPSWRTEDSSATHIAVQLIAWIKQSSDKLKDNERAWLSTEILESLFGKFKQVEQQQSKGGFTRVIAAIPTLCIKATKQIVRKAFQSVNSPQTREWINASLGKTLNARRNAAYRESRPLKCAA